MLLVDIDQSTHGAIGENNCPPQPVIQCSGCGFVLVTDNVDKNIRPSYQREYRQTQSLHYCNSCATKNRVNITGLSDNNFSGEITVEIFLPTENDLSELLADFEILISRFTLCHMQFCQ